MIWQEMPVPPRHIPGNQGRRHQSLTWVFGARPAQNDQEILLGNMVPPSHHHPFIQPPSPIPEPAGIENSHDPRNVDKPQSMSREIIRYVNINLSTRTYVRNVELLFCGARLNELLKVNTCTTTPHTNTASPIQHTTQPHKLPGKAAPQ